MRQFNHIRLLAGTVLVSLFVTASLSVNAQDIHLSQYDAPPMYLNPALTGKFNGRMRIHGHYRTQWKAIADNPYVTTLLSGDRQMKDGFSLGAQIMNQRAGAGNFNEFRFNVSGAYDLITGTKRAGGRLSVGAQLGFIQKSFDISKLTFDEQYRITGNEGGFDPTVSMGENLGSSSINMMDVSVGVVYFISGESKRINPFIGYAGFHLNQPKETFFNGSNFLPMRHVVHGGVKLNLSEKVQLTPKAWMQNQTNDNELTTTLVMHYYLSEQNAYLIVAPTWRKDDAAIMELGMKYDDYIVRVSYDINTSPLKAATTGRGGFEISLTWIQEKKRPDPAPNCPRL